MSKDPCDELLSQYVFTKPKDAPSYYVVKAQHRETSQPYSIKVTRRPSEELFSYLSKLRDTKSEYVTRIHDLVRGFDRIVIVC
jgi:hypothetical protein